MSIAVDSGGNAYVAGIAPSTNFPTVNPIPGTTGANGGVFVTKLNAAGTARIYATVLGGNGSDIGAFEGQQISANGATAIKLLVGAGDWAP